MKILITSIVDLKSSQHNRPHQFVKYLSKKHDVTVLSINDWWKSGQNDLYDYNAEFDNVFRRANIIHITNKRVSPILQELFSYKKVGEVIKEGFDVHLNYSTLLSGLIAAKELTTVYDIADDLGSMIRESPQIPKLLRPFGGALGDFLVKKNIEKSNLVTVTTETLADSYDIPKNKLEILPNGVDTSLFMDYGEAKRQELGLEGFVIGYVGVLREWVDLEPIFIALKNLNKCVKMIVVGSEGRLEENMILAEKLGVKDRVIFTGMVPYYQVPLYISAMDVCLIPFRKGAISKNALPLKLFEYMACERPIISSHIPSIKRIAGNKVMYASSADEYLDRIKKLYEEECLRKRMGKEGRLFIGENYNWSHIMNNMERLLERAII